MMAIIHLVPSSSDKSLCGLNRKKIESTSIGFGCNCDKCMEIGQKLLDSKITALTDSEDKEKKQ